MLAGQLEHPQGPQKLGGWLPASGFSRVVVQKSAWRCVSQFFHVVRLSIIFFRLANIHWFDFDLDVWDQIGRMQIFGFP
jgi:hypothetical protein